MTTTNHTSPSGEDAACSTCNGHGMIGGPSYYSPDEGGEPCPDCNVPQIGEDAANGAIGEREAWLEDLKRIAHELRTYNPAADEYKGEHIHKVWAREIEALLPAASNGEPK